jgi:hypothetical protein
VAQHLERLAASPFELLRDLDDAEAERAARAKITYTAKDHETNPYRFDDLSAQGLFRETQGDLVASIWKFEAQPVRLPWSSSPESVQRTIQGQLLTDLNARPYLGVIDGSVILRAAQIDAELARLIREAAADAAAKASERANQLAHEARRAAIRQ